MGAALLAAWERCHPSGKPPLLGPPAPPPLLPLPPLLPPLLLLVFVKAGWPSLMRLLSYGRTSQYLKQQGEDRGGNGVQW